MKEFRGWKGRDIGFKLHAQLARKYGIYTCYASDIENIETKDKIRGMNVASSTWPGIYRCSRRVDFKEQMISV